MLAGPGLMGDGGWEEKVSWAGLAGPWLLPVLASLGFMGCGGLAAAPALPRPAPPPPANMRLYRNCWGCCRDELTARCTVSTTLWGWGRDNGDECAVCRLVPLELRPTNMTNRRRRVQCLYWLCCAGGGDILQPPPHSPRPLGDGEATNCH